MNMYTSSELATRTRKVCDAARTQGCAVITTNGKADLAMIDLSGFDTINDFVHAYDGWRMEAAMRRMQAQMASAGITDDDIESEIAAARAELAGTARR